MQGRHVSREHWRNGQRYLPKGKWEELPPVMVARYLRWRLHMDTRWVDSYRVSVRVPIKERVRVHVFTFEERAHAVLCEQWWTELGYSPTLKVL